MKGVYFLSYAQFQAVAPDRQDYALSIADRFYLPSVGGGWRGALQICFSDADPDVVQGPFPVGCVLFSDGHAELIRSFTDRIRNDVAARYLVIHCHAGRSRSAALAWWAHRYYGWPLLGEFPPHGLNRYILANMPGSMSPPAPPDMAQQRRLERPRTLEDEGWRIAG